MRSAPRLVIVVGLAAVLLAAVSAAALTPMERCKAIKLAAMGKMLSTKLHCHAWAAASEAPPEPLCFAHAEQLFAEQLRGPDGDCATPAERDALLLESGLLTTDVVAAVSPGAQPDTVSVTGIWETDSVIDIDQFWTGTVPPAPDVSECKRAGRCPANILLLSCRTAMRQGEDGRVLYESSCRTAPESGYDLGEFPISSEVTQIGALEYRIVGVTLGGLSYGYEVTIELDAVGGSYSGVGSIDGGAWTIYVTGRRVA